MSDELFHGDLDTPPLRPQGQTAWDELEHFRRRYFDRVDVTDLDDETDLFRSEDLTRS